MSTIAILLTTATNPILKPFENGTILQTRLMDQMSKEIFIASVNRVYTKIPGSEDNNVTVTELSSILKSSTDNPNYTQEYLDYAAKSEVERIAPGQGGFNQSQFTNYYYKVFNQTISFQPSICDAFRKTINHCYSLDNDAFKPHQAWAQTVLNDCVTGFSSILGNINEACVLSKTGAQNIQLNQCQEALKCMGKEVNYFNGTQMDVVSSPAQNEPSSPWDGFGKAFLQAFSTHQMAAFSLNRVAIIVFVKQIIINAHAKNSSLNGLLSGVAGGAALVGLGFLIFP